MSDIIHARVTGTYPLSIATSVAIEALTTPVKKGDTTELPISKYSHFWINLRTLARNIITAVGTDNRNQLTANDIESALYTEMAFIEEEVKRHNPEIKVIYYGSDLDLTLYPFCIKRKHTAPVKALVESLIVSSIAKVLKHFKNNPTDRYELLHFRNKLKPNKLPPQTAIILTHIAFDLVAYKDFKSLTLIESHTGAIKERSEWYTKYYDGEKLSRLPFNEKLLQIFGDKESFSPLDPNLREAILKVAEKYRWTPLTTEDKINYGINSMSNRFFIDFFKKL